MHNKNYKTLIALAAIALAGPLAAQAQDISLDLGASSQDFTMYGLGDVTVYGPGYSNWSLQQGSCGTSGGNTMCTLSGSYTSTSSALPSGAYSFVTEYPGTGPTATNAGPHAPLGLSHPAFSNDIVYPDGANGGPLGLTPGINMTLTLDTSAGDFVEPIVVNGAFAAGAAIGYLYSSAACSGAAVSTCSVYQVGQTPGAIISGPVTMTADFVLSQGTSSPPTTGVPEPATLALLAAGLAGLGFTRRRLRA